MRYKGLGLILILVMAAVAQTLQSEKSAEDGLPTVTFRPGDGLKVLVHPDTTGFPNGVYSIDGEGYADLPVAGRTYVVDQDADSLAAVLKELWADYLRYPNVQVRPVVRISLLGGFYRPGLYWIDPRHSFWNAMQLTGGPQRSDGFRKMVWERGGKVVRKDLVSLTESGKSLYELGFITGDQIRVTHRPEREKWDVFRQDVLPTMTLMMSIAATSLTFYYSFIK